MSDADHWSDRGIDLEWRFGELLGEALREGYGPPEWREQVQEAFDYEDPQTRTEEGDEDEDGDADREPRMAPPGARLSRGYAILQMAYAIARVAMAEHRAVMAHADEPWEATEALIEYVTAMLRAAGVTDAELEIVSGCELAADDDWVGDRGWFE